MKTIKQYINNNKHLLLIFSTTTFLMLIYSVAFCNPVVLMTLLPSVANKFIDKAFEVAPYFADKAIAATPYVAYGTGWIVVGSGLTLASIKTLEYGYNWRYIANQTTNSIPLVGWAASGLQWGYEKITGAKIKSVEYTYFLPKIATSLGYPNFFNSKFALDLSTFRGELMGRQPQIEYRDRTTFIDTPITEYRDRENLTSVRNEVINLTEVAQSTGLIIHEEQSVRDNIVREIGNLSGYSNTLERQNSLRQTFDHLSSVQFTENSRTGGIEFSLIYSSNVSAGNTPSKILNALDFEERFPLLSRTFQRVCTEMYEQTPGLNEKVVTLILFNQKAEHRGFYKIIPRMSVFKNPTSNTFFMNDAVSAACHVLSTPGVSTRDDLSDLISRLNERLDTEERWVEEQPSPSAYQSSQTSAAEETLTTSTTDIVTPLAYSSVALIGTLSQLPLDQVFSVLNHLLGLEELAPLLHNPEVIASLRQIYENNGVTSPEFLTQYIHANPQDTQISGGVTSNPISNESTGSMPFSSLKYLGIGALVCGLGFAGYYLWKNTGDSSVLQVAGTTASTFEQEVLKGLK